MQRLQLLCEVQGGCDQGEGEEVMVAAQALCLLADQQAAAAVGGEGGEGEDCLEDELVPFHCLPYE